MSAYAEYAEYHGARLPPAHLLMKNESILVPFGVLSSCGNDAWGGWITTFGRLYVNNRFMGNPILDLDPDHADIVGTIASGLLDKYNRNVKGESFDAEFELILDLMARLKPKSPATAS